MKSDQKQLSLLTPRPEPPDLKENDLTKTPTARPTQIQIAILTIISVVCVALVYGLFRLDRRLSFTEGRVHELLVAHVPPAQLSTASESSTPQTGVKTNQSDGPEIRVPAKPLLPEITARRPAGRKRQTSKLKQRH